MLCVNTALCSRTKPGFSLNLGGNRFCQLHEFILTLSAFPK